MKKDKKERKLAVNKEIERLKQTLLDERTSNLIVRKEIMKLIGDKSTDDWSWVNIFFEIGKLVEYKSIREQERYQVNQERTLKLRLDNKNNNGEDLLKRCE